MTSLIPSAVSSIMTSREISELTGKRHADVMRDIRVMIGQLSTDADLSWYCETATYVDAKGESRDMYRMDKDTTLTLVSGYNAVLRFRIIKRWQELETQPSVSPYAALSSHTVRAVQVEHSKSVNAAMIRQGGRNAIVAYNLKNCTVQSGRLPQEWKVLGKQEGLPSKDRNSAKDVLRVKAPQVACGMSLADQLVAGGAKPDDGISIGKDSQFIFQRILSLGIAPPELLL